MPALPGVDPVIRSIIETILRVETGLADPSGAPHFEETVRDVRVKLDQMPRHLGLGMLGMTAVFDAWGAARAGKPFRHQPFARRQALIRSWKRAPVGLLRDFVAFYEKMGVFIYYSHVEEAGLDGPIHPRTGTGA